MDFWDWLKSLRTWWWMILVFPVVAAGISWIAAPEPEYESRWTVNIFFDDPMLANTPGYVDFIFLDDLHLLMETGVLGDVMYLRLPEETQSSLSRDAFGEMVKSSRRANFVEIVVVGDNPELITIVAETINANLEEIANLYLIPPTYTPGLATVNTLDPISEPAINTGSRTLLVGSVTGATFIVSIAATGMAEWLRRSYRAKYSAR